MPSSDRSTTPRWATETGDIGDWRDRSRCREAPKEIADLFWEPGDGAVGYSLALKLCAECPVREECLEQNIDERDGVYGGLTPNQRKQLRIRRGARPAHLRKREPFRVA